MQTPKTRAAALEVPQRTQKTARQLKTSGTETDNSSSQNPVAKTSIARSPKVADRRSPRTPTSEKKRTSKVSELETQLANLQEELKKAKDQLSQSESQKNRAHEEAEDAKKQLTELTEKLQDSQQQLDEISASDESRLQELIKVSQDRDRAWESELDAVKTHHSMDSAALAAAVNEVQKLMIQLEKAAENEANHAKFEESVNNEMLKLKLELSETLGVVEELKIQLKDSQDSEARTRKQLETVDLEKLEAVKSCEFLTVELEKSKAKVDSLEEIVSKLEMKNSKSAPDANDEDDDGREEINCVKMEVEKLKEELGKAYELVEEKTESSQKVSVLEAELKDMKGKLENVTEENKNLHEKMKKDTEYVKSLKKLEADLEDLKRIKFENETELKFMTEELEKLKMEKNEANNEVARIGEKEAVMKVERVKEQLDLAQAANAEMEAELRRLKVQTDQWRKAAEAAATMISGGTNGNFVERTGSFDTHTRKLHSPLLEDMEDNSPKKKNGNMLKKFGVFMKSKR